MDRGRAVIMGMVIKKHSHAGLVMATEEHCLSPVITEAISPVSRQIATLRVPGPHTCLVILKCKEY